MPFHHFFGPPPVHFFALHMTAALAVAATAYYVVKNGVPAGVSRMGSNIKQRFGAWRDAADDGATANSCCKRGARAWSTGNTAFDTYRDEAVSRLEQEAEEFRAYLDGLRGAKDKAEFDRFIAERKAGGSGTGESTD